MEFLGGLEVFQIQRKSDQRAQGRLEILRAHERKRPLVILLGRRRVVAIARELPQEQERSRLFGFRGYASWYVLMASSVRPSAW